MLKKLLKSLFKPKKEKVQDKLNEQFENALQIFGESQYKVIQEDVPLFKEEWYYDRVNGITYYVLCPLQSIFLNRTNGKLSFKSNITLKVGRTFHNPKDPFIKAIAREQSKKNAKDMEFHIGFNEYDIIANVSSERSFPIYLSSTHSVQNINVNSLSELDNFRCFGISMSLRGNRLHPWVIRVTDFSYRWSNIASKRKYLMKPFQF